MRQGVDVKSHADVPLRGVKDVLTTSRSCIVYEHRDLPNCRADLGCRGRDGFRRSDVALVVEDVRSRYVACYFVLLECS